MAKIIADSDIPIDDDMKEEIRETAGLEVGDTIFFIADNEKNAALYAGQIRTALGERLDLIEKNSFKFCYINDFPMSGTAQDLMYGAPSEITEQQLREVHIKVRD